MAKPLEGYIYTPAHSWLPYKTQGFACQTHKPNLIQRLCNQADDAGSKALPTIVPQEICSKILVLSDGHCCKP